MINLLLLSVFIYLFTSPLFAADEPLKSSSTLGSYVKSPLPQLNIDYDGLTRDIDRFEYSQPLQNFEKDDSAYCPHTEILTKLLNELRNLPQESDKIKDVLSNYYTILEKALNSRNNVESPNVLRSKNDLNYIDSIVQKLKNMVDKNVKIKISFEYELPKMHKTICEKLCNDLINFANAGNSSAINDVNDVNEPGKNNNKILTYLQNYRPENIHPMMNKPDIFYPTNSDSLPSNPDTSNMTLLNLLQSLSQPLSKQTGPEISQPVQNLPSVIKSPTETNLNSIQQLTRPLSNNANVISLQNLAALTQKAKGLSDPNRLKYLLTPFLNPVENSNSYSLQNSTFPFPSLKGNTYTATYSVKNLSPPLQESIDPSNKYYLQNLIPMLQSVTGSSNSYPFQNLSPLNNYLQNVAPLPQTPTEPENYYPIQNLLLQLQGLTGSAKDIEEFKRHENSQYHHQSQKQVLFNNNALQYTNKNNIVTPTKYENSKSDIIPNSWSQSNYVFTKNKYRNNEKLLQERLIQLYNQNKLLMPNFELETSTPSPTNIYQLNTNALPNNNQYDNRKLEIDPSSVQTALDKYNQYLQSVKNLIYSQTNSGTGHYLLNQQQQQQIPYSLQNFNPFSNNKRYAPYNSYVKNYNQLATQSNTPNRLALYPNSYYSNPNLGLTNRAKGTQENYDVQFQDLHRLLAVSNLDKLNSISNKNGIIELTYKLSHTKPAVEPFYYVKYKLPYNVFMLNLKKLLTEKPNLRYNPHLLYKDLLIGSNITASSSDLKSIDREELLKLVSTNGTLVTAKVLDADDIAAMEQIKIVQNLNANMPLEDIVKTDANITKVADLTSKDPLLNLRDRPNYLNDLQRSIAMNGYYLNSYNTKANQNSNQYVRYPNYSANRLPTLGYNYLQNQQNYPYSSYALNPFSRYLGNRG